MWLTWAAFAKAASTAAASPASKRKERLSGALSCTAGAPGAKAASTLATARYKAGLVIVLEVIDAERTLLQAQRANLQILNQQMYTSVALIKALGGGWDTRKPVEQAAEAPVPARRG